MDMSASGDDAGYKNRNPLYHPDAVPSTTIDDPDRNCHRGGGSAEEAAAAAADAVLSRHTRERRRSRPGTRGNRVSCVRGEARAKNDFDDDDDNVDGGDGRGRSRSRSRSRSAGRSLARHGEEVLAAAEPPRIHDDDRSPSDRDGSSGDGAVSGFSSMRETSTMGRAPPPPPPPQRHAGRRSGRSRSRSRSRSRGASRERGEGSREARRSSHGRGRGAAVTHRGGESLGGVSGFGLFEDSSRQIGAGGGSRSGGNSGRVGGGGGDGGAGGKSARGMEPAVKGCGIMTTTTFLKLVTLSATFYFVVKLWTVHYHASSGRLCTFSDANKCVTSALSKVFLTTSRASAGALFPSIVCGVLSKCYATRYFLHHSWLALIVSFEPAHELHTFFGSLTLWLGVVHGCAHIARVINEGAAESLGTDQMNRSGLAALLLLLPIGFPMILGTLKKSMTFEYRKALHLLFIPFTIALCFHGQALRAVCAIILVWYLLDRLYFTTRMSFYIDRPVFRPVGRGTFVRFDLPPGYQFKVGAYIQVNCPAISAGEWHPFSIFPVPGSRPRAGFHVEAVGDWTQELFRLSLEDPCMPLWVTAPQPSVLEKSIYFDNVMLVCTGAGITPAVSLADMCCKKKNVYLMWLSREAGMIAMFEKQLRRVKSTVHLTGNPSAQTKQRLIDLLAPSKSEVVATAGSACPSRASSGADLTALEAGGGGGGSGSGGTWNGVEPQPALSFCGVLREECEDDGEAGTAPATDDGLEDSVYGGLGGGGGSAFGGSVLGAPAAGPMRGLSRNQKAAPPHHVRRSSVNSTATSTATSTGAGKRSRRVPFGQPISLNFGRPDIEKFIRETVGGTAMEGKWAVDSPGDGDAADAAGGYSQQQQQQQQPRNNRKSRASPSSMAEEDEVPPTTLRASLSRSMMARLSTNQRISKRDLMSADLSVIAGMEKGSPQASQLFGASGNASDPPSGGGDGGASTNVAPSNPRTWLVLYCGANAKVERAVATACDDLGVTWRKEYFSAW